MQNVDDFLLPPTLPLLMLIINKIKTGFKSGQREDINYSIISMNKLGLRGAKLSRKEG